MDLFGIGWAELVLILIIAFIVLGPERLPEAVRTLSTWMRQLRTLSNEFTGQLRTELADATRDLQATQEELRRLPHELTRPLKAELADTTQALQAAREELQEAGRAIESDRATLVAGDRPSPHAASPQPPAGEPQQASGKVASPDLQAIHTDY